MNKLSKLLGDPWRAVRSLGNRGFLNFVDDRTYLRLRFRAKMGYWPNLERPQTYSEKIQWLKLHDRDPLYTVLADKYAVREYVADRIGPEYLISLLGKWDRPGDIDFDSLPDRFVLKCSHDSNSVVICRNKASFDAAKACRRLAERLERNPFYFDREWAYKDIVPCIICEEYLEDTAAGELKDYKFFCFGGVPRMMLLASGRQDRDRGPVFDYFDMDFRRLDMRRGHPNSPEPPEKPAAFEEMKKLAEALSRDLPHARIDFYQADGRVYFGEITFYPAGGSEPFDPPEWDARIGGWLDLEPVRQKYGAGTK